MTGTGAGARARRPALDAAGWVAAARRIASPNRDARPPGTAITLVVVHGISLPPGEFGGPGIVDLFTNRLDPAAHPYYAGIAHLRVSAHFLIRRRGELLQFVACTERAWHAGASTWKGRAGCNDFSIGIELEGTDDRPYTAAQYVRLARLSAPAAPPLPAGRPGRAQRRRARAQDRPGAGVRLGAPARPPRGDLTRRAPARPGPRRRPRRDSDLREQRESVLD